MILVYLMIVFPILEVRVWKQSLWKYYKIIYTEKKKTVTPARNYIASHQRTVPQVPYWRQPASFNGANFSLPTCTLYYFTDLSAVSVRNSIIIRKLLRFKSWRRCSGTRPYGTALVFLNFYHHTLASRLTYICVFLVNRQRQNWKNLEYSCE